MDKPQQLEDQSDFIEDLLSIDIITLQKYYEKTINLVKNDFERSEFFSQIGSDLSHI
jgi:hypothetical protein